MDFDNRINNAQSQANTSYQKYNQYQQLADDAYNKFNTQFDNRQSYGDIYNAARDQYYNTDEINAARDQYQTARDAVDQLNTTISRLPESIRQQYGGTGLTEAQRQRALQSQYSANSNTYNMLNTNYQNAMQDYNDLANRAMQEVQNAAAGNYQSQEYALNSLQNAWATLLSQRNTAYQQNQADRGLLADQYGARDDWQLAQDQMALQRWQVEQENARAAAERQSKLNLYKYLADQSAAANNAQAKLKAQLADRQNRVAYNQYRNNAVSAARRQYDRDANNLGYLASQWLGGNNVAYDNLERNMDNIMSYEQWAGLV